MTDRRQGMSCGVTSVGWILSLFNLWACCRLTDSQIGCSTRENWLVLCWGRVHWKWANQQVLLPPLCRLSPDHNERCCHAVLGWLRSFSCRWLAWGETGTLNLYAVLLHHCISTQARMHNIDFCFMPAWLWWRQICIVLVKPAVSMADNTASVTREEINVVL